tara:strand:- start:43 stop:681 length:639 start_codon:yes stop_codon:yes gene_type:complete
MTISTLQNRLDETTETLKAALALDYDADVKPAKRSGARVNAELTSSYNRDYKKFYFAAFKVVKDSELARDIVHDAFARSKARASQFNGTAALSSYIFRIVVNMAIDHVRSHGHRASVNGGAKDSATCESDWTCHDVVPKPFMGPLKSLILKEKLQGTQAVLDNMSPKKRDILERYALAGESYKEIAESTGLNMGTVMSRLNAARVELRAAKI